jgi:hypothetical protein
MENVFCHIVGLNNKIKDKIIDILQGKNFNFEILDLDKITQKIINDKNMNIMYQKYEEYFQKSKLKGSDKTNMKKYKEIEKKMSEYWKNKFKLILEKEINKIKKKQIILIGLNTHFKHSRIYVKIDCKLKFFIRLDLAENAKSVIETNLDNHRNEIIEGTFPLEYLEIDFLIKKRENLLNIYKKNCYELKSITSIIKIINNNIDLNIDKINDLYYASRDKKTKVIKMDAERIVAYSVPWVAAVSCMNCDNIKKGFKNNNGFIKQQKKGGFNQLKKECYLYKVSKDDFYHHENGKGIKFVSSQSVKILENYYIKDIHDYLIDNGIKLIK